MGDSKNGAVLSMWSTPECPFTIEYSPRALDDIRLAVVDAFFSLPHGGAEIGGILYGNWDGQQLTITDFAALDCEHAFGPSFALSLRDEARLGSLLAATAGNGLRPVGWYHSHTRSEILLSDADQEIHRRFFPEPWQVALVLKPHTFHPTRAGIFFRDARGEIHGKASYAEFDLTPLAAKAAPSGGPARVEPQPLPDAFPEWLLISRSDPRPAVPAPEVAPPLSKFFEAWPSSRWPMVVAAVLLACCAVGAAAYWERDLWAPRMPEVAPRRASALPPPPPLGLNTMDSDGQLQIRWDRNSPYVQRAIRGVLSIDAGGRSRQDIPLDRAHLLSGVFTFARQTERVDVSLGLTQADGQALREVTMFVGKLPDKEAVEDPVVQELRHHMATQVAKIQTDLDAEIAQNAKLQRSVEQLSKQLRKQQRIRPLNKASNKR